MIDYNHKWSWLPAVLLLVGLTLFFFWKILLTNLILSGVDVFLYFYPYKAYTAEALRSGRLPLWNPHLFMGAPLLANSQVGLFYPLNWLFLWLDAPRQLSWSIGLHVALAGSLTFGFARYGLRLSPSAALTAAILFGLGGYLTAQVEHINQLQAAAWLPLLFWLYHLSSLSSPSTAPQSLRRRVRWTLLLALVIALMLLAGHAQTVFIALFGLGLYAVAQGIQSSEYRIQISDYRVQNSEYKIQSSGESVSNSGDISGADNYSTPTRRRRDSLPLTGGGLGRGSSSNSPSKPQTLLSEIWNLTSGFWTLYSGIRILNHLLPIGAASLLAVALAALQLWPTAELSGLSIRSGGLTYREVVSFSLRPTNLHYSLLPPLGLDLTQPLGQAFSEWVAYLGWSGLLLALLGSVTALWQPPARRFLFVGAVGLVLSLGLFTGPLYAALYYVAPGFSLFRVPARWLLLYAFSAALLAGYGVHALQTAALTRRRLDTLWRWFSTHRRWLLLPLPALGLAALILWKTPPWLTLVAWLGVATAALLLMGAALRGRRWATPVLLALLIAELFWASQALNYNRPTAPQAYHSMRNATAFLLSAETVDGPAPPGRFLSLSGITYDPGDLRDLEQIFGDQLSPTALYNLIVATKQKEVLFFNLPLIYKLHSVDGYDGGILPLANFVTFQRLFLPADDLSLDGRLREKLRFVPANWLLSLTNSRWIVTDKQFDAWIDGIFYDLQFPARLTAGQTIAAAEIPTTTTTHIGLVSHMEGAATLPNNAPVARLTLTLADGSQQQITLVSGVDTAEGVYDSGVAHNQAAIGVTWPYEQGGVDYVTIKPLAGHQPLEQIEKIEAEGLLPHGQFVLRGLSLIHQPTTTSRSVIVSTEGDYRQVHSGDVKIYENRGVLPRAFVLHQALRVPDEATAIAAMTAPDFDPARTLLLVDDSLSEPTPVERGQSSTADSVRIEQYEPERVTLAVTLDSPGWLFLSDSYYPGWQATINNEAAEIIRANLLFRAVALPAGRHTVVFEFKPDSFYGGALISGVALLGVILALLSTARRRQKEE